MWKLDKIQICIQKQGFTGKQSHSFVNILSFMLQCQSCMTLMSGLQSLKYLFIYF